jgi:hypothetical protein
MADNKGAGAALPRWKCHKEVWAAKITGVRTVGSEHQWLLDNSGFVHATDALSGRVPSGLFPVGGYYVRYEDGYESWSPAKAFEDGYTRI